MGTVVCCMHAHVRGPEVGIAYIVRQSFTWTMGLLIWLVSPINLGVVTMGTSAIKCPGSASRALWVQILCHLRVSFTYVLEIQTLILRLYTCLPSTPDPFFTSWCNPCWGLRFQYTNTGLELRSTTILTTAMLPTKTVYKSHFLYIMSSYNLK